MLVKVTFQEAISDSDSIQVVETLGIWAKNKAISNAILPITEIAFAENQVVASVEIESGNCYRKHGKLSEKWIVPDTETRGWDLFSLLTLGRVWTNSKKVDMILNPLDGIISKIEVC